MRCSWQELLCWLEDLLAILEGNYPIGVERGVFRGVQRYQLPWPWKLKAVSQEGNFIRGHIRLSWKGHIAKEVRISQFFSSMSCNAKLHIYLLQGNALMMEVLGALMFRDCYLTRISLYFICTSILPWFLPLLLQKWTFKPSFFLTCCVWYCCF